MRGRTWPTVSSPGRGDTSCRRTTRTRNGLPAPTSRLSVWWASTSRTTIRSSPSAAPRSSSCNAEFNAASLRQLTDSVCCVAAVAAAVRYVVTSPPRKA